MDPTEWLPNELLLIILAHYALARVGAKVCRRWRGLCRGLNEGRTRLLTSWSMYNKGQETPAQWKGHTEGIRALAAGHNNKLYSASKDCTIRVWSMEDGRCLQTLTGHTGWVTGLAIGRDGTVYSASGDKTVRVWSGVDGSHLETFDGHTLPVRCVLGFSQRLAYDSRKLSFVLCKHPLCNSKTCLELCLPWHRRKVRRGRSC